MNYIIDGHNLIAKIPGMDLSMLDDEEQLIKLLNRYGEHHRGKIEVYFDGAPAGQAGVRSYGRVRAHFVVHSQTADEAIRGRLARLGKSARSWVVVSSDRAVQAATREVHAGVLGAEEFTRHLLADLQPSQGDKASSPDQPLSQAEVDEWLAIFNAHRKPK